jgi:hypothetical protein
MRLTREQLQADARKMKRFICSKIPEEGTRIVLADGPDGEAWAELNPIRFDDGEVDLHIETNCPEWVDLAQIYEYFQRETDGEMAQWSGRRPGNRLTSLRRHAARFPVPAKSEAINLTVTEDEDGLPREVSTADAARILGISKDTVLRLKAAGLLEYRNTGSPGSCRPVFAFTLRSVLELRTNYERDIPIPRRPKNPTRRRAKGERKYKHLRLTPD